MNSFHNSSKSSSMISTDAQSIAQYITDFLDLVENVPNEVSRHITQLHILHHRSFTLMDKLDHYKTRLCQVELKPNQREKLAKRIEISLIQMQEIADNKLRIAQNIIEIAESKARELETDYDAIYGDKDNGLNVKNSKLWNPSKTVIQGSQGSDSMNSSQSFTNNKNDYSSGKSNHHVNDKRTLPKRACAAKPGQLIDPANFKLPKKEAKYAPPNFKLAMAKYLKRSKKMKGNRMQIKLKAARNQQMMMRRAKQMGNLKGNISNINKKESQEKQMKRSISPSSSGTSEETFEDNKKEKTNSMNKIKKMKKRRTKKFVNDNEKETNNLKLKSDSYENLFVGEPIAPDEPVYCLCAQVSFGDMICCDNDLCSIEWFHFPCVDLTTKPKGKWFCPNCRGDKSTVPKSNVK